jgi:hypothetical protein
MSEYQTVTCHLQDNLSASTVMRTLCDNGRFNLITSLVI